MSSLRICLMLALVLAVVGPAASETYYVAQNQPGAADSNPGTEAQPWLTLAQAAKTAQAGDTVWIRAGIYQETLAPRNSGTREKPITFQAFGDDPVFISSPTLLLTGWKKREGTKMVYEAAYPMQEEVLVVVDGVKVPNGCPTGPRWWLGIPGMGEVTDEPFMMGGTPVLKRCAAQGGKVTINLGGEDPSGHRVEAVRRDFTGIMLKGDYLVVRGLQVTDVSSGVTDDGAHNLMEYVVVRNAWAAEPGQASFSLNGSAGVARRCTSMNSRELAFGYNGDNRVVEECLALSAGHPLPSRMAPEDVAGMDPWGQCGYHTGSGSASVCRYNVSADAGFFGWWSDIGTRGAYVYGNAIWRCADAGIYNEAMCQDSTLVYNTATENRHGFQWRWCDRMLAQYNYIADNRIGVINWGEFTSPSPTDNIFRKNLILRSDKAWLGIRRDHAVDLQGEGHSWMDRPVNEWDLLEDNLYTLKPGGIFMSMPPAGVEAGIDPMPVEAQYKTLAEFQAATGREHGSQQREADMEEFGLTLYTMRIPYSSAPYQPVPIVGNAARFAIHYDPLRTNAPGFEWRPYFWGTVLAGGIQPMVSRRPFLAPGSGPRLKLDVPATVWLEAKGGGAAGATAEPGGWRSPNLPTVPGAKIRFSFLADGKDLKAPTEDTIVSWVRFSSLTGQHVSRQFIAGKDDAGHLCEAGPCQGDFGWRKISGTVTAPEKAERFEVFIGLRPCEGRARFADLDLQTEAGEAPAAGEVYKRPEPPDNGVLLRQFMEEQFRLQQQR